MITEAEEGVTTKEEALTNFKYQVSRGESMGVIQMYENVADSMGATSQEIEQARKEAQQ